jgi:protein-tyrosine phosphatase
MIKVLFICHGNICRSTMAEYVMKHLVKEAGREGEFFIDSAATSTEEIGNGVHHGTRRKLAQVGIPCGDHLARQVTWKDYESFDYIIGMDNANIRNLNRMLKNDPDGKISMMLDYTSRPGEVADPWYTGDFEETYRDVLEGCQGLLKKLS